MRRIKLNYVILASCALFLSCQNTSNPSSEMKDSSNVDTATSDNTIAGGDATAGDSTTAKGSSEADNPGNLTHQSKVDDDTALFMKDAGLGGMMEVDLGKLAQSKSTNNKVKEFAAKMVTDHTKDNNELKALAAKLDIILPADYPADQKAHMDEMKKLTGTRFDKHYMDMMVKDHVKTLDLFRSAARLRNNQVQDFAAKTLPVLETHHKLATEINATLK